MTLYLSHATAALYWLFARKPLPRARCCPSSKKNLRDADTNALDAVRRLLQKEGIPLKFLDRVELLSIKKCRPVEAAFVTHFQANVLLRGSCCRFGDGFCVVSPELSFLQMAQVLPFPRLLEYGYALTGTFCYSAEGEGLVERKPLTSVKKLAYYATNAQNQRGRRTALRAIRYLLDKSASPAETHLALLLSLPYRYGGYAVPAPQLNKRIDVSPRNSTLKSKRYYVADECWPDQRIVVEYDSNLEHTGSHIGDDAKKRLALQEDGYLVISVTASQLYSYVEMDKIGRVVRRRLGLYDKPLFADYESRKAQLRKALLLGRPLPELVAQTVIRK